MTAAAQPQTKLLFESQTCPRCGGCGRYSWNAIHGSRCYGCGGCGEQLTKRGAAAQKYFRELCTLAVKDVVVGDVILTSGLTHGGTPFSYWATVTAIGESENSCTSNGVTRPYVAISLTSAKYGPSSYHTFPEVTVESRRDRKAKVEQALAYQASLTQAGKPAKRRA